MALVQLDTFFKNEGFKLYKEGIKNGGVWGGDVELSVLADELNINIIIESPRGIASLHPVSIGNPSHPAVILKHTGLHYHLKVLIPSQQDQNLTSQMKPHSCEELRSTPIY